jgi:hypothetical protein
VKRALHRLGRPPVSPDIAGCHVPVDRRERIGESARCARKRPPTEAALLLILGPSLLTAFTFEHARRAPCEGIEHGSNLHGLRTAMVTVPNKVRVEAGKRLVLQNVTHLRASPE